MRRGRFAPSPTGWLHLGHVANAAWTWETARSHGARVILRIEDHDRGRCRPEYERQVYDDLAWLGLAPDPESLGSLLAGSPSPWRQSDCIAVYEAALDRLAREGLVYGCDCSRSAIAAQAGDGAEGSEPRYPGTCRDRGLRPGPGDGTRIRLPETDEVFDDLRLGLLESGPARMAINRGNGLVSWLPSVAQVGVHSVRIGVHDTKGGTAGQQFELEVLSDAVNRRPIVNSTPRTHGMLGR